MFLKNLPATNATKKYTGTGNYEKHQQSCGKNVCTACQKDFGRPAKLLRHQQSKKCGQVAHKESAVVKNVKFSPTADNSVVAPSSDCLSEGDSDVENSTLYGGLKVSISKCLTKFP